MEEQNSNMIFNKTNYKIMLVGLLVVVIGFILMSGGKSPSPNEFNADEIFSTRRITIAPITVLLGYVIVGYGILKKTK